MLVSASRWVSVDWLGQRRHLFVHDLVTLESERGGGYGSTLIKWLESQARAQGCSRCRPLVFAVFPDEHERATLTWERSRLVLDSNTERQQAHRFYHAHGLTIRSFHFAKDLV